MNTDQPRNIEGQDIPEALPSASVLTEAREGQEEELTLDAILAVEEFENLANRIGEGKYDNKKDALIKKINGILKHLEKKDFPEDEMKAKTNDFLTRVENISQTTNKTKAEVVMDILLGEQQEHNIGETTDEMSETILVTPNGEKPTTVDLPLDSKKSEEEKEIKEPSKQEDLGPFGEGILDSEPKEASKVTDESLTESVTVESGESVKQEKGGIEVKEKTEPMNLFDKLTALRFEEGNEAEIKRLIKGLKGEKVYHFVGKGKNREMQYLELDIDDYFNATLYKYNKDGTHEPPIVYDLSKVKYKERKKIKNGEFPENGKPAIFRNNRGIEKKVDVEVGEDGYTIKKDGKVVGKDIPEDFLRRYEDENKNVSFSIRQLKRSEAVKKYKAEKAKNKKTSNLTPQQDALQDLNIEIEEDDKSKDKKETTGQKTWVGDLDFDLGLDELDKSTEPKKNDPEVFELTLPDKEDDKLSEITLDPSDSGVARLGAGKNEAEIDQEYKKSKAEKIQNARRSLNEMIAKIGATFEDGQEKQSLLRFSNEINSDIGEFESVKTKSSRGQFLVEKITNNLGELSVKLIRAKRLGDKPGNISSRGKEMQNETGDTPSTEKSKAGGKKKPSFILRTYKDIKEEVKDLGKNVKEMGVDTYGAVSHPIKTVGGAVKSVAAETKGAVKEVFKVAKKDFWSEDVGGGIKTWWQEKKPWQFWRWLASDKAKKLHESEDVEKEDLK